MLFAAGRTLLAWNRTCILLMVFGYVVERFGLFLELVGRTKIKAFQRHISFVVGEAFILLAASLAIHSIWQHKTILNSLPPAEIPRGHNLHVGMIVNAFISVLWLAPSLYLARGFSSKP